MMNIQFLNVDLEIESQQDISLIVKELKQNVCILHHEKQQDYHFARLEIDRDVANADKTINYFCDLIENFSEEARKIWDSCCTRIFDIGYESGMNPNYFTSKINALTIKRIANIDASINITIYSINDEFNS